MSDKAYIHLRVPAATKGRWIRESRSEGMKLGDWIVRAVEGYMATNIKIPNSLSFDDLKLALHKDGDVSFDVAVIELIERANSLPAGFFMSQHEDVVGELIVSWYNQHRASGGKENAVAENLIHEALAEGPVSHRPGQA